MTADLLPEVLDRIRSANKAELRRLWARHLRAPCPHNPVMLRYSLAWHLQAQIYGGLSVQTRRRIQALLSAYERDPNHRPQGIAPHKPGTEYVRIWKGAIHRVRATTEGFEYEEVVYATLSAIARKITGTQRSGPEFFAARARTSRKASPG